MRIPPRPAVIRQLPRRNFTVGLHPGIEEQQIAREAATYNSPELHAKFRSAVEMLFAYFGMMGVAFAIGGFGGAMIAEQEVCYSYTLLTI
jgi:hypothetical protein